MPKLVPEFDYTADLVLDEVGPGPFGNRVIANVTGGRIEGTGSTALSSAPVPTGCSSARTGSAGSTCAPRSRPATAP